MLYFAISRRAMAYLMPLGDPDNDVQQPQNSDRRR
jgi:hypothetical protein